jgi:hypothetical protein
MKECKCSNKDCKTCKLNNAIGEVLKLKQDLINCQILRNVNNVHIDDSKIVAEIAQQCFSMLEVLNNEKDAA